jgi:thiamine pyrophosphate-dependent acetolactate synthase large subunit-like protein
VVRATAITPEPVAGRAGHGIHRAAVDARLVRKQWADRADLPQDASAQIIPIWRGATDRAGQPNRQRAAELAGRLTNRGQARFAPAGPDGRMDPRALAAALDQILPLQRCVTVDGGHFSGWPVMHLRAADPASLLYPHGFQSIGLGLGSAVGLALARPDRLPVAIAGDGGLMMSLGELDTLLSEQLPVLVALFNDHAYGAEWHHFAGPADTALAQLPERDFAGIFQAMGGPACTIRTPGDLGQLQPWLRGRSGPFLIDCKISQAITAPWLRYAFPAARQPAGRPS